MNRLSIAVALLATTLLPGLSCEEPQPIRPVCTTICPDTPVVWTDCDGVRGVSVPNGWKLEEYDE